MTDHEKLLKISQIFNHWFNKMDEMKKLPRPPSRFTKALLLSCTAMMEVGIALGEPWENKDKAEAVRAWKSTAAKPGDRKRKAGR